MLIKFTIVTQPLILNQKKLVMNVPLDMGGNIITNSPFIKPQIFAFPGTLNSNIDGKYVNFGGHNVK